LIKNCTLQLKKNTSKNCFLFNWKKGLFSSNGEYAYILSTGGCIYFLENSLNFWRSQGNLREFFSTVLVDTMIYKGDGVTVLWQSGLFFNLYATQTNFFLVYSCIVMNGTWKKKVRSLTHLFPPFRHLLSERLRLSA